MQNAKSIIFFFRKFCFAALLPARPIDPAPNSRTVPIVSCAVRRSRSQYRSQYRSPVPLVPVHRTSSSSVGHQFVVVQVRPLARSPSGPVPHQFPVTAISSSSRQVAAISQAVAS
ncbi:hypothetical protein BDA96_03G430600 [Sorghum bicolor]|uniref:Secreted protein n=1 Tax=Sorghum bicolor TaxID=4558 RepID=A0A921RI26_SORBI|nr:hypothetical protein BDA96_03G430600 [Sorghum bicolor]